MIFTLIVVIGAPVGRTRFPEMLSVYEVGPLCEVGLGLFCDSYQGNLGGIRT